MLGMNPALTMASRVMPAPVSPIAQAPMSGAMQAFLSRMGQLGRVGADANPRPMPPVPPDAPMLNPRPMITQGARINPANVPLGGPTPNLGVAPAAPPNWQQFLNPNMMQDQ
jgi:hypothetical protein